MAAGAEDTPPPLEEYPTLIPIDQNYTFYYADGNLQTLSWVDFQQIMSRMYSLVQTPSPSTKEEVPAKQRKGVVVSGGDGDSDNDQ